MSGQRAAGTPRTVPARLLSVLDAFDIDHPTMNLSEISAATGLALSTTSRLVHELHRWGALSLTANAATESDPASATLQNCQTIMSRSRQKRALPRDHRPALETMAAASVRHDRSTRARLAGSAVRTRGVSAECHVHVRW